MPNKIKKILLLIITILIMKTNINVKAVDVTGGGLSIGLNSACSSSYGYVACYSPKFQFRITLVKQDGTKVEGTNSVDFTYSTDGTTKVSGKDGITANGRKVELINTNHKYAYGANTNSEFKYIETYMVENPDEFKKYEKGPDDPDKYSGFINKFSDYIRSRRTINKINLDKLYDIDFLSLFAYYSGFTKDEQLEGKRDIDQSSKKNEIAEQNYYLLIEPTYTIYYNTAPWGTSYYKYGTASEIVEWIYNETKTKSGAYSNGYLTGLSLNFISQAGCNLYTPLANTSGFSAITGNADCNSLNNDLNKTPSISRQARIPYMEKIIKQNNGYAKYVLKLNEMIPITGENYNVEYTVDLCQDNDAIFRTTVSGIKTHEEIEDGALKYISNDAFLISGEGSSSVYCYDEVVYDFSDMVKGLKSNKHMMLTNIDLKHGKITINRRCYFATKLSNETDAKNYNKYKNLSIILHAFNQDYNLVYIERNPEQELDTISDKRTSRKKGWVEYQISLEYGYNDTINISKNNDTTQNAYILFNNTIGELFDSKPNADGIMSQMIEKNGMIEKNFEGQNITYKFNFETSETEDEIEKAKPYKIKSISELNDSESLKCSFNFDVLDIGDDLGNLGAQFRIISLSNPFPARDGKSRIPGTNWLNEENNVYNYIINNRSIQYIDLPKKDLDGNNITKNKTVTDPEMMYLSREPIYTVTLDPQTMLKIRKYNRNKDYTDINLTCDSNNRQCTSSFLRDNDIIPSSNLKGTCADKTEYNKVINEFGKENLLENIRKAVYVEGEDGIITYSKGNYNSIYDLNKNNRMDKEDIEIYENKEKNTIFYTCADKTYKSGG